MPMISTPSLSPGARTLPHDLRIPHGNAYGWYRLHSNVAPVSEPPTYGVSGLGGITCDENGVCTFDSGGDPGGGYVDPSWIQTSQIPTESPYPVVMTSVDPSGQIQTQSMTPAQLTALINAGSASLQKIIALTQGGSVLANGSIIGSQQAAQLAAAQSGLSITSGGLSGMLSNPIILIGGLAVIALILTRK